MRLQIRSEKPIEEWSDARLIWAKLAILWCLFCGITVFVLVLIAIAAPIVRAIW